ncbi:terpene synthase family protein [Biscogniauxia sp. FL1348]|nr:terpene synthase family protein [Biscogniauxia sp. FL1348]
MQTSSPSVEPRRCITFQSSISLKCHDHGTFERQANLSYSKGPRFMMKTPRLVDQGVGMLDCGQVKAELDDLAKSLIKQAILGYDNKYGFGSMSCAIYDTAWVSLVIKVIDGRRQWLFEECFTYILDSQSDDGSWKTGSSQTDVILNTAASLLSLKRHMDDPLQIQVVTRDELRTRISAATESLQSQLHTWDVASSAHVGFEIIVPSVLELLEQEGIVFDFAGRSMLEQLRAAKLSGFNPEMLYGAHKSTIIHSLESFIGKIDFDKVAHHRVEGALMASPSSTAAYLMNASTWDDESEAYLRHVICSTGKGSGGVPSAFPSTYFEYTWLLSTLLRAGYNASDLACEELKKMKGIITQALVDEDWTLGFAHNLSSDVDDTARALISMGLVTSDSRGLNIEPMISRFATDTHYRTYPFERNPSFTANCNVLLALLRQGNMPQHLPEVVKVVKFITHYWWRHDGNIRDKWNLSPLYSAMLLVEALTDLFETMDTGVISEPFNDELMAQISITLFQACLYAMVTQKGDGSWGGSVEQTSYGILILCQARRFCPFDPVVGHIESAVQSAVAFIESRSQDDLYGDCVWIEKVTYGSPLLTNMYRIAALKASSLFDERTRVAYNLGFADSSPKRKSYIKLLQQTPMFSDTPDWQIHCSMIEATLFSSLLRPRRLMVFSRKNMEEDKYFDMIPFIWTACNNRTKTFASASFLFEMMVISFLSFQADEYMEAVAAPEFSGRFGDLRQRIDNLFHHGECRTPSPEADDSLERFISHVLEYPLVAQASKWDQQNLIRELHTYLLSHVAQAEDNYRLANSYEQDIGTRQSFYDWVRTTASDQTACPYAFAFVSCLLSSSLGQGADCFPTVAQKYFAQCFCRHLATMCRMYNDYGSVSRDQAEGNLNSVDFPEFGGAGAPLPSKKQELFKMAEYERCCLNDAIARLESEAAASPVSIAGVENRKLAIWRVFYDVTDLHGQIYVIRDIASRKVVTQDGCGRASSGEKPKLAT